MFGGMREDGNVEKKWVRGRYTHSPWRLGTVSLTDIISDVYLFMLTTVASEAGTNNPNPLQHPEQQDQQQ